MNESNHDQSIFSMILSLPCFFYLCSHQITSLPFFPAGLGDTKDRYEPCLVPTLRAKSILQVAAGYWHSMAGATSFFSHLEFVFLLRLRKSVKVVPARDC